MRLTVVKR